MGRVRRTVMPTLASPPPDLKKRMKVSRGDGTGNGDGGNGGGGLSQDQGIEDDAAATAAAIKALQDSESGGWGQTMGSQETSTLSV